nr:MAG TPA: hypothetical protein [Caudoviricetes sp.]
MILRQTLTLKTFRHPRLMLLMMPWFAPIIRRTRG